MEENTFQFFFTDKIFYGPFVYRLGRKIFILERGVRFPHGLQVKRIKN